MCGTVMQKHITLKWGRRNGALYKYEAGVNQTATTQEDNVGGNI